jgi:hypothetical protein
MNDRGALIAQLAPVLRRITVDPESGCWLWQGATTADGYPHLKADGRTVYAHRLILAVWEVPIDGLVVHHRVEDGCRGPRCVLPDHLVAMSNAAHVALHHRLRREAAA